MPSLKDNIWTVISGNPRLSFPLLGHAVIEHSGGGQDDLFSMGATFDQMFAVTQYYANGGVARQQSIQVLQGHRKIVGVNSYVPKAVLEQTSPVPSLIPLPRLRKGLGGVI